MSSFKNKKLRLYHQDSMVYTKEFLLLKVPREVIIMFYTIVLLFLTALCIVIFVRIDDVIKAGGIVRTKDNVSGVHNVIAGKITQLYYSPGVMVRKGDPLYLIDSSGYDAQFKNLSAEKENLATKLDGIRQLKDSFDVEKNLVDPSNTEAYSRFEYYLDKYREFEIQEQIALKKYLAEKNRPASLRREKVVELERLNHAHAFTALESLKSNFFEYTNLEKKVPFNYVKEKNYLAWSFTLAVDFSQLSLHKNKLLKNELKTSLESYVNQISETQKQSDIKERQYDSMVELYEDSLRKDSDIANNRKRYADDIAEMHKSGYCSYIDMLAAQNEYQTAVCKVENDKDLLGFYKWMKTQND